MSKLSLFFSFFFATFVVDQITKWWGREQGIVTFNTGISLSLFSEVAGWVYVLLTVVLLVVLGKWLWKVWRENISIFGCLCSAAISNAVDRIFFVGVQDFLPVPFFNIKNNVADWVICGCLVWVGWQLAQKKSDY